MTKRYPPDCSDPTGVPPDTTVSKICAKTAQKPSRGTRMFSVNSASEADSTTWHDLCVIKKHEQQSFKQGFGN